MLNEGRQNVRTLSESTQFTDDSPTKVVHVRRSVVGHPREFRVTPNSLVRVEFRSICWEVCCDDTSVFGKELANHPCAVDVASVPDDGERPAELSTKQTKEFDDLLCSHVLVVCKEMEVKADPPALRADSDCADGRDPISAIPASVYWRLSTRGVGAANRRREHKTRFIEEYERGPPLSGFFLKGGSRSCTRGRSPFRCAPVPAFPASARTNQVAQQESSAHGRGGTLLRNVVL